MLCAVRTLRGPEAARGGVWGSSAGGGSTAVAPAGKSIAQSGPASFERIFLFLVFIECNISPRGHGQFAREHAQRQVRPRLWAAPGAQGQVLAVSDMTRDTLYRVGLPVDLSTVLSVTVWGRASWTTTQV